MNKISLNDLKHLVKQDLAFAQENAQLCVDHECFNDQKEYWAGKIDALERVIKTLQHVQEVVDVFETKKKTFLNFLGLSSS